MAIRKFLVGAVLLGLVLWGPTDPLWIRLLYLAGIPVTVWFILDWLWRVWEPDRAAEDRLKRTLAGVVAAIFFVGAAVESQRKQHAECTQYAGHGDNRECVGDYEMVKGPDKGRVMWLGFFGVVAFWFGIQPPKPDD